MIPEYLAQLLFEFIWGRVCVCVCVGGVCYETPKIKLKFSEENSRAIIKPRYEYDRDRNKLWTAVSADESEKIALLMLFAIFKLDRSAINVFRVHKVYSSLDDYETALSTQIYKKLWKT
jgi:hypothetical protein